MGAPEAGTLTYLHAHGRIYPPKPKAHYRKQLKLKRLELGTNAAITNASAEWHEQVFNPVITLALRSPNRRAFFFATAL